MYRSLDEIVTDMMLYKMSESVKQFFKALPYEGRGYEDLHKLIRAAYSLDDIANPYTIGSYTPNLIGGVDHHPNHPYNFCGRIIHTIWKRLQ